MLYSVYVGSPASFENVDIRSVHGDLVLNFGDGNKLILLDTTKSEITYDDFGIL